jgi:hypothetical protein
MKIWKIEGSDLLSFECPACGCLHFIREPAWTFNQNFDKPTITPSILVNAERKNPNTPVCHSFVTNGMIEFLNDCSHDKAGMTMEIPEMEE